MTCPGLLEARLIPKVLRNSLDPVLGDGIYGVRGPHAVSFIKDLLTLDTGFDVPLGGSTGELDFGLRGERPGVLSGRETREDVAGVVCVRGPIE